jgi:hypothetical protein
MTGRRGATGAAAGVVVTGVAVEVVAAVEVVTVVAVGSGADAATRRT